MKYRGKIDQLTIFGQLEFIENENYTNRADKQNEGYLFISGKYKVVGSDDEVDLNLRFFGKDLDGHRHF